MQNVFHFTELWKKNPSSPLALNKHYNTKYGIHVENQLSHHSQPFFLKLITSKQKLN